MYAAGQFAVIAGSDTEVQPQNLTLSYAYVVIFNNTTVPLEVEWGGNSDYLQPSMAQSYKLNGTNPLVTATPISALPNATIIGRISAVYYTTSESAPTGYPMPLSVFTGGTYQLDGPRSYTGAAASYLYLYLPAGAGSITFQNLITGSDNILVEGASSGIVYADDVTGSGPPGTDVTVQLPALQDNALVLTINGNQSWTGINASPGISPPSSPAFMPNQNLSWSGGGSKTLVIPGVVGKSLLVKIVQESGGAGNVFSATLGQANGQNVTAYFLSSDTVIFRMPYALSVTGDFNGINQQIQVTVAQLTGNTFGSVTLVAWVKDDPAPECPPYVYGGLFDQTYRLDSKGLPKVLDQMFANGETYANGAIVVSAPSWGAYYFGQIIATAGSVDYGTMNSEPVNLVFNVTASSGSAIQPNTYYPLARVTSALQYGAAHVNQSAAFTISGAQGL